MAWVSMDVQKSQKKTQLWKVTHLQLADDSRQNGMMGNLYTLISQCIDASHYDHSHDSHVNVSKAYSKDIKVNTLLSIEKIFKR